jgi:hypothetical protein
MNTIQTGIFSKINSVSDIILAMTEGLKKEWVKIDMQTYGAVYKKVCFGCAATNTLCQLMGEPFNASNINNLKSRREKVNFGIDWYTLKVFEMSLDNLRLGRSREFIHHLIEIEKEIGIKIETDRLISIMNKINLPELDTDDYKKNLHFYEKIAAELKKEGL